MSYAAPYSGVSAGRAVSWAAAAGSWAARERGRFFPWLAVAAIAGAVLYVMLRAEPPVWAGGAVFGLSALAAGVSGRVPAIRGMALMLAAAAAGFAAGQAATSRALPIQPVPLRAVMLTATVRGVDVLPDGRRLVLEDVRLMQGAAVPAPDTPALARAVRVRMKRGDASQPASGDRIELRALLRAPAPPAYPGGWDIQRDLFFNGIGAGGTALSDVRVTSRAAVSSWTARVNAIRDTIAARAMAAVPGAAGAVAATLLTGSTTAIPLSDRAAFRDSGLAHILAVAGLHIGIIMGLFVLVTRLGLAAWPYAALHWPTRGIAAVTALSAGAAYLVLTGAHVPIMRSFAMASLVTLAIVAGRRAVSYRGLALGAMAIVAIAPNEAAGVSFQMSFAAVLALIAGYEALRPLLSRLHGRGWRRVAGHVVALVLTSLLAGTASMPYGAYHFGHIQLYYVAANVVAVPLTAFWVMPLGVAALLLMPLGLDHLPLVLMDWGIDGIIAVARIVAAWPAATLPTPPMPGWGLVAFSLGLAWLCLWRTRVRLAGLAAIALGAASPWMTAAPDLLISAEARLIVLRGPDGYREQARPGAQKFTRESWQAYLGVPSFPKLGPGCDATSCRAGSMLLLRGTAHQADCTGVTLTVSSEPARGICPGALLDRFTVWRDGAASVWLTQAGPVVLTDRAYRGARPWVPPPPTPRSSTPNMPMAPTEALPAAPEDE